MPIGKISLAECTFIRIDPSYQIKTFDCGDPDLNEFLLKDAIPHLTELMAITYLFEYKNETVAFCSLLNDKVSYDEKQFPRFVRAANQYLHLL
jgi:hypothetical protein